MGLEDSYIGLLKRLPGLTEPIKRLTFRDKLKWTGIILFVYFVMSQVTIYGIAPSGYEYLRYLEILLGSTFGSLITLGIGPIVTASIILQLLVGSKIIPWDLTSDKGRILFQGTQKLLAILFCVIEGWAYVVFGAIPALNPGFVPIVVFQLALGGWLIILMDELISKWGFGSGVGLFIVAGVAKTIIVGAFNPFTQGGSLPSPGNPPVGQIPFAALALSAGEPLQAFFAFLPILATVIVFFLVVYAQAIRVEIPLAFSTVRGFGRRWPLKFLYTSNIPVILIAALLANIQVFARVLSQQGGNAWLGTFDSSGSPTGGLIYFLMVPRTEAIAGVMISIGLFALLGALLVYFTRKSGGLKIVLGFGALGGIIWYLGVSSIGLTALTTIALTDVLRLITYSLFLIGGAVVFSIFWVSTAGMDAKSVASQIESTGMQIPGYRRDIRIIEKVLNRYIPVLAVLGGAAVGFLAAFADFTGALGTGTGILLAVMIIYQLYEEIAMQHMEDMHPAVRRFFSR
jgi:preprotein translocase subunit SecY